MSMRRKLPLVLLRAIITPEVTVAAVMGVVTLTIMVAALPAAILLVEAVLLLLLLVDLQADLLLVAPAVPQVAALGAVQKAAGKLR